MLRRVRIVSFMPNDGRIGRVMMAYFRIACYRVQKPPSRLVSAGGRQAEKKRLTLPSITANIQISAPQFRPDDGHRFANDGCHGNLAQLFPWMVPVFPT